MIKANALAGGAPGDRTGSADHYKITTPDTIGYFQFNKVTLVRLNLKTYTLILSQGIFEWHQ